MINYTNLFCSASYEYLKSGNVFMFLSQAKSDSTPDFMNFFNISQRDVTLAFARISWVQNTVYQPGNIVLTDSNIVYKCIYNNAGQQSKVKPTGTTINLFETSDGYIWKYMYALNKYQISNFLSASYVPVDFTSNVDIKKIEQFSKKGEIEYIEVQNPGSGYSGSVTATIEGNGFGAQVTPIVINGSISKFKIVERGSGYTSATITVSGNGSGFSGIVHTSGKDGHGTNFFKELNVNSVIITKSMKNENATYIPDSYSYNQVGLANKLYSDYDHLDIKSSLLTLYKITVSEDAFAVNDVVIINGTTECTVVAKEVLDNNTSVLYLRGVFDNNDNICENTTIALKSNPANEKIITRVDYSPDVKRSVNVLYYENIQTKSFYKDSSEKYRLVLNF